MQIASRCPDAAVLRQFLVGEIPDAQAEPLEQHFLECGPCAEALNQLAAQDTLVKRMQTAPPPLRQPAGEVVDNLIERLFELQPLLRTPTGEATPVEMPGIAGRGQDIAREAAALLAPPERPDEIGRLGGYRVLKLLSVGGMGIIFHAEDLQLRRPVALKVLKPALAASDLARQRFRREARAAAGLSHDHIVTIYQEGEERGVPFLAMQLLHGESLDDRLRRDGRLPVAEVVRIGREIAAGLAAAHARGLIHRDIKPANIWLETRPGEPEAAAVGRIANPSGEPGAAAVGRISNPSNHPGRIANPSYRVKILDFGLVRALEGEAHLTQTGVIAGTPQYMAPEQAGGEALNARADLFSLGCVLYRMATGQVPFPGDNTLAVLRSLELKQPDSPRQLNPEIPPTLADLILHLLAKKPGNRPASAADVARALAAISPPAGMPDPKPPAKKKRWLLGTAAAGTLLILGFGVYALSTNPDDPEENPPYTPKPPVGRTERKPPPARKSPVGHTQEKRPSTRKSRVGHTQEKRPFAGKRLVGPTTEAKADPLTVQTAKPSVKDAFRFKAERAAAEWVLKLGGKVIVTGNDNPVDQLARLPQRPFRLRTVFLQHNQGVTDAGLEHFQGLTGLLHLYLSYTRISNAGLEHLKGLKHLQSLYLWGTTISDAGLAHLQGLTRLEALDLSATRISHGGLEHLKRLTRLRFLFLNNTRVADAGLKHLKGLTGLRVLHLMSTPITDAGLEHLQGLTGLQELSLTGTRVSDLGLKHLQGLTGLNTLALEGKGISDAGLERLKGLTGLWHLRLTETAVADAGLEHLKDLTQLQGLYLINATAVSGAGLKHLKGLKNLKALNLSGTTVSDAGLEHLQGLTGLQWLDLSATPIADAGLEHLRRLTGLQTLSLNNTRVSDAGLEHLRGLTELLTLQLQKTAVSQAGVRRLRAALRKCTITP